MPELVCVELNPRYVEVGHKVLPEAEWICGDIFDPAIQHTSRPRALQRQSAIRLLGGEPRYRGVLPLSGPVAWRQSNCRDCHGRFREFRHGRWRGDLRSAWPCSQPIQRSTKSEVFHMIWDKSVCDHVEKCSFPGVTIVIVVTVVLLSTAKETGWIPGVGGPLGSFWSFNFTHLCRLR